MEKLEFIKDNWNIDISDKLTENEIIELTNIENFIIFCDCFLDEQYEYSGNLVITEDKYHFKKCVGEMCCGIYTDDAVLSSGKKVYFGFDYGH